MSKTEITDTALMSLDDLDAAAACARVHRFPYDHPTKGTKCGVILHVIGEEADIVQRGVIARSDENRQKEAERAIAYAKAAGKPGAEQAAPFKPTAENFAENEADAASRLVGWEGIAEPWSPENALRLVTRNDSVRRQVMAKSRELANFM